MDFVKETFSAFFRGPIKAWIFKEAFFQGPTKGWSFLKKTFFEEILTKPMLV